MSVSAAIKSQMGFKALIEKSYENFKKSPKDRLAKESYITTRLESLEEKWKVFVETHTKLLSVDEMYELFCNVEEVYIEYKSDLKEALSLLQGSVKSSDSKKVSKSEGNVKLPKITIPTFSGSYTEWTTFKDLYTSLVHNNTSIDDVQKMHYLKSNLSGEAEQLLRHVPITAANYQESWLALNNRYNNKKFLSNCLLRRFMNQPSIGTESCSAVKDILDVTNETLNGLKNLGIDVSTWDTMINYIICSKLDSESRKEWEFKISTSDELPTLNQMREFLESRFRSLEFLEPSQMSKPNSSYQKAKVMHALSTGSNSVSKCCSKCKSNDHKLSTCKEFSKMNYEQRRSFVQTNNICFNCLGRNHSAYFCRVSSRCQVCKSKHHSLLHPSEMSASKFSILAKPEIEVEVKDAVSSIKSSLDESSSNVKAHFSQNQGYNQILLATAVVGAQAGNGCVRLLRALVDQGSQASFITESAVQLLGLRKVPSKSNISGLGNDQSHLVSKHIVVMNIESRHDPSYKLQIRAHVLGAITSLLPSDKVEYVDWPELKNINLADPEFHTPSKIDILLGADVYGSIIREGLLKGPKGTPTAQCTALGWILSGPTHNCHYDEAVLEQHCHHNIVVSMHCNVDELLKMFWQLESDIEDKEILTQEEQRCEEFYSQTTQRDCNGRYVVRLPFCDDDPQCKYGKSKEIAIKRFNLLENRFKKNPELKSRYSEVIHEYLNLRHVVRVTGEDRNKPDAVYIPHHAVIREDRTTTKVRVVFDASCKGTNGVSLNDTLMIGPRLQQDVRHIIIRWRMHPICLSADLIKMYRQVIVADEDTDFQRMIWRDDPESEIEEYKLVRVTFGTASAPYLAVKTLQQIAKDEGAEVPEIAEKVKLDFYVDDLLTGCQTVKETKLTYQRPQTSTELEQRKIKVHLVASGDASSSAGLDLWTKFSTLQRLVRVVAYCRRVLKYKRNKKFEPYLTACELSEALDVCIRQSQIGLEDNKNKLNPLSPFLDEKKIVRVGGRIQKSDFSYGIKHPIILPHKSHFTNLVVDEAHRKTLHGGPTLMLNHLRTRYWIISAKSLVKMHVRKCIVCVRHAARTTTPFMGQLPISRVTPTRPFLHSGVDFAGPINVRMTKGRGNKSYKGYISLFVCMATKAIHIEVVSDLTSEGFIAAFKRFVARRGHVSDIWSDNGTNFVGASKELHKLVIAEQSSVAQEIREWFSSNSVSWHFIPAHAPNFGGLWEAGVKSTKFHLKRVIGESTLTYEELTTVLNQIEACLNSRPLSMLPDDKNDAAPLTPGHFLIGEPLVIVPEKNYEQSNIGTLRRWQLTQKMVQDFWRRWSTEYLVHCLQRYKWSKLTTEPKIDDVVLVKEDNLPPARWMIGRVVSLHPGSDQIVRVVTLKCGQSLIKRPMSKLCVLPVTE